MTQGGWRRLSAGTLVILVLGLTMLSVPLVSVAVAAASAHGEVFPFGSAADHGSPRTINAPVVGMASTPSGGGYWIAARDGGVFAHGDAGFFGSAGGTPLNQPVVGISAAPSGRGYTLVAADGGVFTYGQAGFLGSTASLPLKAPIVGIGATPSGQGYWLVAADGGVFAYGDARFRGSMGARPLNAPVVGMAATATGRGYWLVARDGGIFAFGDAIFAGSTGGITLNQGIVAMAATSNGGGYWFVAADGGVFAFGDARFRGSLGSTALAGPVVGMARPTPDDGGYWLLVDGAPVPQLCLADRAGDRAGVVQHPEIDLLRVCARTTPTGLALDLTVRAGLPRDQLLTMLANRHRPGGDDLFFQLFLHRYPTGQANEFANRLVFGADGQNPTVDIFLDEQDPSEVPRHLSVGLAVSGSTYSFGPVPYDQLAPASTYWFSTMSQYEPPLASAPADSAVDVAPDDPQRPLAGPITRP